MVGYVDNVTCENREGGSESMKSLLYDTEGHFGEQGGSPKQARAAASSHAVQTDTQQRFPFRSMLGERPAAKSQARHRRSSSHAFPQSRFHFIYHNKQQLVCLTTEKWRATSIVILRSSDSSNLHLSHTVI
ncbi:unnamed protein product [Cylicocyclus nassatus]|uniref:Uncharacterized protein n=1 Tax=Cylicocyclus nassatus TaxID=53992 RepID=A0AA36LZ96_CYLNA|nr:unnamed protein product [Cylicocyclus nassatus]